MIADAIIFDLEDAIPDDNIVESRQNIERVITSTNFGDTETCVRVNGLRTNQWKSDIHTALTADVDTIVLPMVEKPEDLDQAVEVVKSMSDDIMEFIATIETPRGLFAANDIAEHAKTIEAVTGLSYGFGDYTRTIGATGKPKQVHEFLRQVVVSAAAIGGLDAIASVYQDFSDLEGLRNQSTQAYEIGYIGQKAIHPAQIEIINDVYIPTEEKNSTS